DLLHTPETEKPQTDRGSQKHHSREIERLRQKLIVLQSVTGGSQTCAFGVVDVRPQLPERHGLWRGEAFAHLYWRQRGLEQKGIAMRQRRVADGNTRIC